MERRVCSVCMARHRVTTPALYLTSNEPTCEKHKRFGMGKPSHVWTPNGFIPVQRPSVPVAAKTARKAVAPVSSADNRARKLAQKKAAKRELRFGRQRETRPERAYNDKLAELTTDMIRVKANDDTRGFAPYRGDNGECM